MKRAQRVFGFIAAAALTATALEACPTCRDALAAADAKWAHGFSVSVLFLLGVLVAVVGTFSFAVWRAVRTHSSR